MIIMQVVVDVITSDYDPEGNTDKVIVFDCDRGATLGHTFTYCSDECCETPPNLGLLRIDETV